MSDDDPKGAAAPPSSIAHTIDASGEDGAVGRTGRSGRRGVTGEDGRRVFLGRDQPHGAPGGRGHAGGAGVAGGGGADGGTLTLSLSGHPGALQVRSELRLGRGQTRDAEDEAREPRGRIAPDVRIDEVVDLDRGDGAGLLRLSATGGNGGHGGPGGSGGTGGQGGKGVRGSYGSEDTSGTPGGNGGSGGDGGRGGDGGPGGDGGDGGRITVRSTDARLFALLRTDVRGGAGGLGGAGGRGGRGGAGGAPGRGARSGHPGRHGQGGRKGRSGRAGRTGRDGRVLWQVVDEAGQVREQSKDRFALTIEGYQLRGEREDAVFEPGEAVIVHDIALHNPGGLTLPAGARLSLTAGAGFDVPDAAAATVDLPALAPGERRVIPGPLHARLAVADGPSENAPLRASADIALQASLLGRTLSELDDPDALVLQHAVEIAHLRFPPRVLAGEEIGLAFELRNVSDAVVERSDVTLRLTLPGELRPTGLIVGATMLADADVAATPDTASIELSDAEDGAFTLPSGITLPASGFGSGEQDGGVTLRLAVPDLAPRETAGIAIGLHVARKVPAYAAIPWAVELGLRGRAVEIRSNAIVAAPRYDGASTPAPVLLIGDDAMDEREHLAWARILETLSLPFDVWDADRQADGDADILARYAGGLIVLPTQPAGRPELLTRERILRHFAPRDGDPRPLARFSPSDTPPRSDAGMLVWGADVDAIRAPLFAPAPEAPHHGHALRRIELRWRRPDQDTIAQLNLGLRDELGRERPERRWRVHLAGEPRRRSPFAWHYGTVQVEGFVLDAGHRLCVVPPEQAGRIGFAALHEPAGFPLGAAYQPFVAPRAFTRAFTAVVTALPMPLKLHALRTVITLAPAWQLENPAGGPSITPDASWLVIEVVGRAIAEELIEERGRPVPRTRSRGSESGESGPWAPRIGGSAGAETAAELGTAAIRSRDLASLPRLEILREALLARPDHYVDSDGPRILHALLELLADRGPLMALSRRAKIHDRRAKRSRQVVREIEGALQAVGMDEGAADRRSDRADDQASKTRKRRDPKALARAWRETPAWAWIEWVTRPGGGS